MTDKPPNDQRSPYSDLLRETLSTVAGAEFVKPRTGTAPEALDLLGWRGIGPITPKHERTANAALQLLKAFEEGTAIGT